MYRIDPGGFRALIQPVQRRGRLAERDIALRPYAEIFQAVAAGVPVVVVGCTIQQRGLVQMGVIVLSFVS